MRERDAGSNVGGRRAQHAQGVDARCIGLLRTRFDGQGLEAVSVVAPSEGGASSKLKNAELAREAGGLAVGTGWLPAMLRAPAHDKQPEACEGRFGMRI